MLVVGVRSCIVLRQHMLRARTCPVTGPIEWASLMPVWQLWRWWCGGGGGVVVGGQNNHHCCLLSQTTGLFGVP